MDARDLGARRLLVAISYANRAPDALFGLDQINIMLTLYLAIGPSGQTLSLDRWLMVRRLARPRMRPAPSVSANLAQRLIQVHMCVIYFFAGISKLQGPRGGMARRCGGRSPTWNTSRST